MTTFSGATHVDNLDAYYKLFRAMLLDPGWREDDFRRAERRRHQLPASQPARQQRRRTGQRGAVQHLYAGTPYGHNNAGTVRAGEDDARRSEGVLHGATTRRRNLIIGLAAAIPGLPARVRRISRRCRNGAVAVRSAAAQADSRATASSIIEKDTRSVAYSLGYPDRREARRSGLSRAAAGRRPTWASIAPAAAGSSSACAKPAASTTAITPTSNISRAACSCSSRAQPGAPQPDFSDLDPPRGARDREFALRLALYELDKLVQERTPGGRFRDARARFSASTSTCSPRPRAPSWAMRSTACSTASRSTTQYIQAALRNSRASR